MNIIVGVVVLSCVVFISYKFFKPRKVNTTFDSNNVPIDSNIGVGGGSTTEGNSTIDKGRKTFM